MVTFVKKSDRTFAEVKEVETTRDMDQLLLEEESLKDRLSVIQKLIAEGESAGVTKVAPVEEIIAEEPEPKT